MLCITSGVRRGRSHLKPPQYVPARYPVAGDNIARLIVTGVLAGGACFSWRLNQVSRLGTRR